MAGRIAVSVLPSPVASSANPPWCITTPAAILNGSTASQADLAFAGDARQAVSLGQELGERLAAARPAAQLLAAQLDLSVAEAVEFVLPVADLVDLQRRVGHAPLAGQAENGLEVIEPARPHPLHRRGCADEIGRDRGYGRCKIRFF